MIDRPPAPVRRRAPRLTAAARRTNILDVAIGLFARAGFKEASTQSLAAALGISEAALFRHFPSKRVLYLAALDHSADVLMQHWRRIVEEAPSPMAALVELGRWYYLELQRDARHLMLRFRACTERDPEFRERAQAHFRAILELVERLYGEARDAGEIAADTDTGAHARLFVAIGTLLDVTQMIGLRELLALDSLAAVLALAMPRMPSATTDERR